MKNKLAALLFGTIMVAFSVDSAAQSPSTSGAGNPSGGTTSPELSLGPPHTVNPGETYTDSSGATVVNNGTKSSDPDVIVRTVYKNRKPVAVKVSPKKGADTTVSGVDSCKDEIIVPKGSGTTVTVDGSEATVSVDSGQDSEVNLNGDGFHVQFGKNAQGTTVNQTGDGTVGDMRSSDGNTINVDGDNNEWGSMDGNNSNSTGSNNSFKSEAVDTSC